MYMSAHIIFGQVPLKQLYMLFELKRNCTGNIIFKCSQVNGFSKFLRQVLGCFILYLFSDVTLLATIDTALG